ncbi:hypothetical protein [Dokdonella fugitiva]|uniref:hypothetical protein n=1 Tax=Dokdonella fugitiva TaxID=328517 RepID=UPI0015FD2A47|nr:hypothetical protein [Dokdonella fugitiva]
MKRIPEKKRGTLKGRRSGMPPFVAIPHYVIDSEEFRALSGSTVKLIVELLRQFNGKNNGLLCTALLRRHRHWGVQKLVRCTREAEEAQFLLRTKQGGMRIGATFHALTWLPLDECDGRIDYPAEKVPSHAWRRDAQSRNGTWPSPETGRGDPISEAA